MFQQLLAAASQIVELLLFLDLSFDIKIGEFMSLFILNIDAGRIFIVSFMLLKSVNLPLNLGLECWWLTFVSSLSLKLGPVTLT